MTQKIGRLEDVKEQKGYCEITIDKKKFYSMDHQQKSEDIHTLMGREVRITYKIIPVTIGDEIRQITLGFGPNVFGDYNQIETIEILER